MNEMKYQAFKRDIDTTLKCFDSREGEDGQLDASSLILCLVNEALMRPQRGVGWV